MQYSYTLIKVFTIITIITIIILIVYILETNFDQIVPYSYEIFYCNYFKAHITISNFPNHIR